MQVVQAPQRVEARLPRQAALLPVNPPEVDAIFLHRVVELVEVDLHELRIGQVELHGLAAFRIDVHGLGDLRIQLFERAHAVPRVDVERGLHAMLVQPVEEALRIREEVLVPRVAGPAGAVLRVDVVNQVPVHIDDGRGERDAFLFETFDELTVFGFGIAVVAAPPVAQHEARQQRGRAGQAVQGVHGLTVAVAVAEQVQVGGRLFLRGHPRAEIVVVAVHFCGFADDVRLGIVDDRPTVGAVDARIDGDAAVRLVERTVGAAEVPALHVAVMPSVFDGVDVLDGCVQAFRRELALVVGDMQRRGVDFQPAITFGDGEFRLFAEITDHRHLRGVIHETAAVGPFETDERVRDEADAPMIALDHRIRIHCRMGVERGQREQCAVYHVGLL